MRPIIFLATTVLIFVALAAPFSAQAVFWVPGDTLIPCGHDLNNDKKIKGTAWQTCTKPEPDKPGSCGDFVGTLKEECDFDSATQLAENLISIAIYLAILVAVAMFAYAGFLYLTSAGDTGKMKQAHTIFTNAAVGLIFVLAAWLIVYLILSALASETFCKSGAAKIIMNDDQVKECLKKFEK